MFLQFFGSAKLNNINHGFTKAAANQDIFIIYLSTQNLVSRRPFVFLANATIS